MFIIDKVGGGRERERERENLSHLFSFRHSAKTASTHKSATIFDVESIIKAYAEVAPSVRVRLAPKLIPFNGMLLCDVNAVAFVRMTLQFNSAKKKPRHKWYIRA